MTVFTQESMDRFKAECILKEAGPEMLAALKQIAAMQTMPNDKVNTVTLVAARAIARQAIIKATGVDG